MFRVGRKALLRCAKIQPRRLSTLRCLSSSSASPSSESSSPSTALPAEADVVVIGGGSLGCNTLYQLGKLGITNAVILEKDKLTAGTTWHSAGLLWRLRPNDTDIQLIGKTHSVLQEIEAETGIDPGWVNNGGLFIAHNAVRLDEYKRLQTMGRAFDIESHVLTPAETKELYPLLDADNFYASLFSPQDGNIDPNGFCAALARGATNAGAKVIENVSVTGIETKPTLLGSTEVTTVLTDAGPIKTKCVVNCAGAWAGYVAGMVGLKIPLIAMRHAYVTTDRIDGVQNKPNVRDHDASVYIKLQGDALHIGGYEVDPIILNEGVARDFAFGLYELDWDVFGVHIEGAVNLIPQIGETGIKSTVCGPESFTPDHKPLMGEDPRVRGFFHGCGFNSSGMMLGGGCGYQLAKWIVDGRPDMMDMYGYDIRRFCPEVSKDEAWVSARSHESYAKNYSIIFPHDEPLAGRNMKKDPIHAELADAGCVFQERHGWERPGWFNDSPVPISDYNWYGAYGNDPAAKNEYKDALDLDYVFDYPKMHEVIRRECLSTRFGAALFDMSYFGKYYLSGADAQRAAEWIFTNNVSESTAGKTVYTCMLNKKGGIEADLTVSALDDQGWDGTSPLYPAGVDGSSSSPVFYLNCAGGAAFHNLSHVRQTIQDAGFASCRVDDVSREMGLLSVQGPDSRKVLGKLIDGGEEALSNEQFPFYTHKVDEIAGHKVRAIRVSFVGELGWELHVPKESCSAVYRALMDQGKGQLINAGYRAIDSLSIEKGYPHWHAEIRMDDTPLESSLGFTCKLKSGVDFLGRAAVEKQKAEGVMKRKVALTLDQNRDVCLLGLEAIYRDGVPVGYVRRADYAFYVDAPLAYGYISKTDSPVTSAWLKEGSYELEAMGKRFPATLHLRTPFDPKNKRLQGDYSEQKQMTTESAGS